MHSADERTYARELTPDEANLREEIHERLRRHGQVDVTKIGILIQDGRVLLWGSVTSESERAIAGETAASVAGRTRVINHIHVFRTSS